MTDLNEYSIEYMFSLDNSRRMLYTVNFVVQILEGKEEDKNLLLLTVSDGIYFSKSFLITKKYEFKKYDILMIENLMRSCPKDPKDIIFINRFSVLSNPGRIIGSPKIFPEEKTEREIKFEMIDLNITQIPSTNSNLSNFNQMPNTNTNISNFNQIPKTNSNQMPNTNGNFNNYNQITNTNSNMSNINQIPINTNMSNFNQMPNTNTNMSNFNQMPHTNTNYKEIKVEKKTMQIKVQKITFNKIKNNQDSNKENFDPPKHFEDQNNRIIKNYTESKNQTDYQIKRESISKNSNIENISKNSQGVKNSKKKESLDENKDKNQEDFTLDIDEIFENQTLNMLERSNSKITSINEIYTPINNKKNSQESEYRLTQEINQSAIFRQIEEINQYEESKKKADENVMKITDLEEKLYHESKNCEIISNEFTNKNPITIDQEKKFNHNYPYSVSNKNNMIQNKFEKSPNNKSAEKSPATSYSLGRIERCSQYRPSLRNLLPKPYILLNELRDGQTDFVIRIRIITYYKIHKFRSSWHVNVIDEKETIANIQVIKQDIDKYQKVFRIYEAFEIYKGTVKIEKNPKLDLNNSITIVLTKDTVIRHIKEDIPNIKKIEETYTSIDKLSKLREPIKGSFSVLGYVNKVDGQGYNSLKQKEFEKFKSFYIIDQSKSKAHVSIVSDFYSSIDIKVGDTVYISNPEVTTSNNLINLKVHKSSVIEINPNCCTSLRLRIDFQYNTRKIFIKELKSININDFDRKKDLFLFKAHIRDIDFDKFQYYDGCPQCRKKLKIDIEDYECEKCKSKRKEPKTFLRLNFLIEDFTDKLLVSCYHESSLILLNYVNKKLKKTITPDDFKRFLDIKKTGQDVKELDEIASQLRFSEFYFKISTSTTKFNNNEKTEGASQFYNNRSQNSQILFRNNNIYYNVEDIKQVELKNEIKSSIMKLNEILNLK